MRLIDVLMRGSDLGDESLARRIIGRTPIKVNGRLVLGHEMDDFGVSPGDTLECGPYRYAFVDSEYELPSRGTFTVPTVVSFPACHARTADHPPDPELPGA